MSKAAMLTMGIGFAGQALFFMRFFVQWIHTERRKESVIPEAFWYFSIIGGLFLLVYAVVNGNVKVYQLRELKSVPLPGRELLNQGKRKS